MAGTTTSVSRSGQGSVTDRAHFLPTVLSLFETAVDHGNPLSFSSPPSFRCIGMVYPFWKNSPRSLAAFTTRR